MKFITILIFGFALSVIACDNDDDSINYPKLYTFSHMEIGDGRFYVLDANTELAPLETPDDYVLFVDTLEEYIEEVQREFLFFEEFELLSEDMIRFRVLLDQTPFDTTVMYTMQDQEIVIDMVDPAFVSYDADADEFQVCSYAQMGIHGPNPPVSGLGYGINIGTCEFDYSGHLEDILAQDIYVVGDTIGFYIVSAIYQ